MISISQTMQIKVEMCRCKLHVPQVIMASDRVWLYENDHERQRINLYAQPYFIPDKGYINALRIAAKAGVDVRLIIPNKPDHIFVYWATITSVAQLIRDGVKVYTYENGFIIQNDDY